MRNRVQAGERGAGRRGSYLPKFIPQNKVGALLHQNIYRIDRVSVRRILVIAENTQLRFCVIGFITE